MKYEETVLCSLGPVSLKIKSLIKQSSYKERGKNSVLFSLMEIRFSVTNYILLSGNEIMHELPSHEMLNIKPRVGRGWAVV